MMKQLLESLRTTVTDAGDLRFLEWFVLDGARGKLEAICKGAKSIEARNEAIRRAAESMELSEQELHLFFCTPIVMPDPPLNGDTSFRKLWEAGYRHPLQLRYCYDVDILPDCTPGVEEKVEKRCRDCGKATLKKAMQEPPMLCYIACSLWDPQAWRPSNTPTYPTRLKVVSCDTCDHEIKACMDMLPNAKRMFSALPRVPDWQGPSSYTSAYNCWLATPTEIVNTALQLRAHYDQGQQLYQWQGHGSRPRKYEGVQKSVLAAEALHMTTLPSFTLQQPGGTEAILATYDMAMGASLMWYSDKEGDTPPPYTTHARGVSPRYPCSPINQVRFKPVAALNIVDIYNNGAIMTGLDPAVQSAKDTAIGRAEQICSGLGISIVMFGNTLYTWVGREDARLTCLPLQRFTRR